MLQTLINAFKNKDIRKKILITLFLLLVYRIGCWIPVPGINPSVLQGAAGGSNTMLNLLSALTGGALANGALFAIGISPYINASIIIQLLTVAIPKLEQWSKQGDEGRKKINRVTRVVTLLLAIAQATGIVVSWANSNGLNNAVFGGNTPIWVVGMFVVAILVAGSMLTMWIGERITEIGVGNGISLLIFVGILSSAGLAIVALFTEMFGGDTMAVWTLLGFIVMVGVIFAFIVFVDLAERRIPIQYAKQIKGRKQYGGQNTFIPIKISGAGVLPIIFANALITFPQLVMSMFMEPQPGNFMGWWQTWLGVGTPIYSVVTGLLIMAFSFFYAQIQFNPEEVSRNIQQYGGFIPGIRPGRPTYDYLKKVSRRITFWGALFLAFLAIVPSIIFSQVLPNSPLLGAFTATGMLIVVSVALEFEKQLQSQLMMKQYKGFLK
ncbi:MAG: preprotein translocase subunit SecY [Firmicutes bacterium]|nr:preprotein translocase subunit SecY [Bacillota bacterium]